MDTPTTPQRILSGMRPTGRLHLGHYHGVLENWVNLQHDYDCYFFAADWHALTTHYEDPRGLANFTLEMMIDWIAAGLDPEKATLFVQSDMPEHAELHVLLSMGTPLSWLERVPTYKDQQEKLKDKDLATYGFLGYPLLQAADILLYAPQAVPVGADQIAHVELTREVARRFNHLYGREFDAATKREQSLAKIGKKHKKNYLNLVKRYQEQGDTTAYVEAQAFIAALNNITDEEKVRLLAGIDNAGRSILTEPEALLTKTSRMVGLDGQKMSKSYGNAISLRDTPDEVNEKVKRMPTDPARIRLTDAGNPNNCPVWQFHELYSPDDTKAWVVDGCTNAKIGCIDCKKPVADSVNTLLAPMQVRASELAANPTKLDAILRHGAEKARETARETLHEVRSAMGLIGRWH